MSPRNLLAVTTMNTDLFLLTLITVLSATALDTSEAFTNVRNPSVKSATFLSPPFFLRPGLVANKFYFDIPFPRGHIAVKSFDAEVVDESGVPVPLHETYLHHWVVESYHGASVHTGSSELDLAKIILVRNSGVCNRTLGQYYGLGSETRRTATWVPDPYGIEVGNPNRIPEGYDERWLLNVHAIDTRGVHDRLGCTECRCALYNVTKDEYGRALAKDYKGGLYCCYDETQCRVRPGFNGETRKLFLRYTVRWADWVSSIVPFKIYIFDVTDTAMIGDRQDKAAAYSSCKVEYEVEECSSEKRANGECVHAKTAREVIPRGGDIVYGVAHQHAGGIGAALYGQDGRPLCTSIPTYGEGQEAGNEANYIVGMSTCYPKPGSVKVGDGEVLTVVSNYSSTQLHTGVMGLFYILVAESQAQPDLSVCFRFPIAWCFETSTRTWAFLLAGVVLACAIGVSQCWSNRRDEYQYIVIR